MNKKRWVGGKTGDLLNKDPHLVARGVFAVLEGTSSDGGQLRLKDCQTTS